MRDFKTVPSRTIPYLIICLLYMDIRVIRPASHIPREEVEKIYDIVTKCNPKKV